MELRSICSARGEKIVFVGANGVDAVVSYWQNVGGNSEYLNISLLCWCQLGQEIAYHLAVNQFFSHNLD